MSFTANLSLIVIKVLLLWLVALYINRQNQRDSASWQHRTLVIFLIASPLLVLSPWMAFFNIPINLPADTFEQLLSLDQYQLPLLLIYAFACSFFIGQPADRVNRVGLGRTTLHQRTQLNSTTHSPIFTG